MTTHKSFKNLVRARMAKTGQSYTAARASLLAGNESPAAAGPALSISEEAIRRRTGQGWEQWFDRLDEAGLSEKPHGEIARWVSENDEVDGWTAQAVTVSYERARGGRAVGEHANGFAITATKTVAVPVEALFDAFVDEAARSRWLPDGRLRERTATKPKSARFDWGDGSTRVNVGFLAKGEDRSTVAVQHERLPDAEEAERMKTWWRDRIAALKQELEAAGAD